MPAARDRVVRPCPFSVRMEAQRLVLMPRAQARAQFGDRVARTFLCLAHGDPDAFAEELNFNAQLATAVREEATRQATGVLWEQ